MLYIRYFGRENEASFSLISENENDSTERK